MNTTTWTQYVSMEDGVPEQSLLDAALASLEDWDEDVETGGVASGESADPG